MLQNLFMKLLLKFDHMLIDIIDSVLVLWKKMRVLKTIDTAELPCNVKLEIYVNTVFFQSGDKVVELFELLRFNERILYRIAVLGSSMTDIVHADYIYTISGKLPGKSVGLFVLRETAGHSALSTEKADFIAFLIYELISIRAYKPLRSGRTSIYSRPCPYIRDIIWSVMSRLKWKHRSKIPQSLNLIKNILTILSRQ